MELNVVVPPHGSILRDLALTSFSVFTDYEFLDANVRFTGDELIIDADEDILVSFLRNIFLNVLSNIKMKQEMRIPSPATHKNDRQVLDKLLDSIGVKVKVQDYLSYAKILAEWARNDIEKNFDRWATQLREIKVKKDIIELGNGKYANLQPFKIEKYEYGKGFSAFKVKLDYKLSREWMAILLSGFALSYSYYADGELILSPLPETVYIKALEDYDFKSSIKTMTKAERIAEALYGERGFYNQVSLMRIRPTPIVAYLLLLGIHTYLQYYRELSIENIPPYILLRVLYTGQTFTMLEKIELNVQPVLEFAKKMAKNVDDPENLLDTLRDFLSCTIKLAGRRHGRCVRRYGDYTTCYKITQCLYQAILGSRRPEELVYLMARTTPEGSPLRNYEFLKGIYSALSE